MDFEQLNSFSNFIDDTSLSTNEKIKRNLYNYLMRRIGSTLFTRGAGSVIASVENEANNIFADGLLTVKIVEAVGEYNLTVGRDLQAIVGSDMISIIREDNMLDILVLFLPMQYPSAQNINQLILSIPSFGG